MFPNKIKCFLGQDVEGLCWMLVNEKAGPGQLNNYQPTVFTSLFVYCI